MYTSSLRALIAAFSWLDASQRSWDGVWLNRSVREAKVQILCCGVKTLGKFFTLHCSSSLSCINEYLAIHGGGDVYEQPSCINCSIRLDASQRRWDGVWVNRSVREVKCKALWASLRLDTVQYKNLPYLFTIGKSYSMIWPKLWLLGVLHLTPWLTYSIKYILISLVSIQPAIKAWRLLI